MHKLDAFTHQYMITALWSSTGDDDRPLDDTYSCSDLSPEAESIMVRDCRVFQERHAALLEGLDSEQAGHDFWLTRNGHGAGFWDGDYPPEALGRKLTEASKAFGGQDLYVGDDGMIYLA